MKAILFLLLFVEIGFCQELEVYVASWPVIEASILLDGKLVGQTPSNFNLKTGRYKFLAKKEGWVGEEREVIIEKGETSPIFINLSMKMAVLEKEKVKVKVEEKVNEKVKVEVEVKEKVKVEVKVEPEKVEPKIEPKKEEVKAEKIEPKEIALPITAKKEYATYELISKTESMIEKAKEEGAERYARKNLSLAKRMLSQAKKEVSYEKANIAITEAEKALKETLEKRQQYDSGYMRGLIGNFGR